MLEDIDEFFLHSNNIFDPPNIAKSLSLDIGAVGALERKINDFEHTEMQ